MGKKRQSPAPWSSEPLESLVQSLWGSKNIGLWAQTESLVFVFSLSLDAWAGLWL